MTNELEDRVATVLRDRPERFVDVDALLAGAVARGRARQRRQRVGGALATAGVAGVTAAALAAGPLTVGGGNQGGGDPGGGGISTAGPNGIMVSPDLPPLPVAEGVAGLADSPELVGTDATTLHFGAPQPPLPVDGVIWGVQDGVETVSWAMYEGDSAIQTEVAATRGEFPVIMGGLDYAPLGPPTSEASATVNGNPGNLETWSYDGTVRRHLTWQVDGVHLRVSMHAFAMHRAGAPISSEDRRCAEPANQGSDPPVFRQNNEFCMDTPAPAMTDEMLLSIGETLPVDTAVRCSAPLTLGTVPTGARLLACSNSRTVGDTGGVAAMGTLSVGERADRRLDLNWAGWKDQRGAPGAWAGSHQPLPTSEPQMASPEVGGSGGPLVMYACVGPSYFPSGMPSGMPDVTSSPPCLDGSDFVSDPPMGSYEPSPGAPNRFIGFQRGLVDGSVEQNYGYSAAEEQAVIDGVEPAGVPSDLSSWPRNPLN